MVLHKHHTNPTHSAMADAGDGGVAGGEQLPPDLVRLMQEENEDAQGGASTATSWLGRFGWVLYSALSVAATSAVVSHAFDVRTTFFEAVLFLTTNKICVAARGRRRVRAAGRGRV
jgi:hypothetical protein